MNAKARLTPVWEKVTSLFRKYRRARRWRSLEEPVDISPYRSRQPPAIHLSKGPCGLQGGVIYPLGRVVLQPG